MSNKNCFKFVMFCIIIVSWAINLNSHERVFVYLIGPSVSKHFEPSSQNLNEFHPGVGSELQLTFKRWVLGFHGYYMIEDSHYDKAFWMGLTAGYRIGKKNNFWAEPILIVGGMKKKDYQSGKFSFFSLPVLSVGYKFIGFNLGYIPGITDISKPILIFQIKLRIL